MSHQMTKDAAYPLANLAIAFLMLLATAFTGYTSWTTSEMSRRQVTVEKTAYTPEFIYLGPSEIAEELNAEGSAKIQYGFYPRFVKVSGFANSPRCEAVSRYVIEIATERQAETLFGPHTYEEGQEALAAVRTVTVDVREEYFDKGSTVENSMITVTLGEIHSKLSPNAFVEYLPKYGYRAISIGEYCVGRIAYTNVENEECSYPFTLSLTDKTLLESNDIGLNQEPIILSSAGVGSNHGFTEEKLEKCAEEIVRRIEAS